MNLSNSRRGIFVLVLGLWGVTLGLGLWIATQAVARAHQALLADEALTAVTLRASFGSEEAQTTAAWTALFSNRWQRDSTGHALMNRAEIQKDNGTYIAVAPLFDREGWDVMGTLRLMPSASSFPTVPWWIWGLAGLILMGLATRLWRILQHHQRGETIRLKKMLGLAFLGIGVPIVLAGFWVNAQLVTATEDRVDLAVAALHQAPPLDTLLSQPGRLSELIGFDYIHIATADSVVFSTLPPTATRVLQRAPTPLPNRITADALTYATRDVGPIRLALLPYTHTENPTAFLIVITLLVLAVSGVFLSLVHVLPNARQFSEEVTAWGFLAPSFILLSLFTLGPLVFAAWLSVHRWHLLDPGRPFVGVDNYANLFGDGLFWQSIGNTAVYTLHVPIAMALALGLALLLQNQMRGAKILRAIFFLPSITSLVAIALVWQWMFNPEFGLLNWVLHQLGMAGLPWLTSPDTALFSIMLMSVWLIVGYQMILFQAGLGAIPQQLYEAARMDGAKRWQELIYITLPSLGPTIFFVLITSVIGSFQVFGAVYVMTQGGPLHATDVAVYHIYKEAWEFLRFGPAAAMSWVLFAIIFAVTYLQFRTLEKRADAAWA